MSKKIGQFGRLTKAEAIVKRLPVRSGSADMEKLLKRAYTRHYRDNGQTKAYVEWKDGARTEGDAVRGSRKPIGTHMTALFARAEHEGLTIEHETWG